MFGYDTLLGSHFDKYTIDYYNYDENPFDITVFRITDGTVEFTAEDPPRDFSSS